MPSSASHLKYNVSGSSVLLKIRDLTPQCPQGMKKDATVNLLKQSKSYNLYGHDNFEIFAIKHNELSFEKIGCQGVIILSCVTQEQLINSYTTR